MRAGKEIPLKRRETLSLSHPAPFAFHEKKNRNVLSPAVSRSASFGGQSGGAITAVLTALGVPGLDQFKLFLETIVGVAVCKSAFPAGQQQEAALQCSFNKIGLPLLAAAVKARDPNAAATISNRVTLCEWWCFFMLRERREREKEINFFSHSFFFFDLDPGTKKNFKNNLRGVPSRRPVHHAAQRRRSGHQQVGRYR